MVHVMGLLDACSRRASAKVGSIKIVAGDIKKVSSLWEV